MGGKAMASYGTVRLTHEQYKTAVESVTNWAYYMGFDKYCIVPEYADKESFGDIDILYCGNPPVIADRPLICNGPVRSTLMLTAAGLVQVDFIRAPAATYDTALAYYSFNDLGNLLGRTARYLGFALGSEGLHYRYKDENSQVHKVLVTADWADALAVLGYKALDFAPTLEQMFAYVKSSPYFSDLPFRLENRTHKGRCRDAKRATYNAFLETIECPRWPTTQPKTKEELLQLRAKVLSSALDKFPDFAMRLSEKAKELAYAASVRKVFNGELVKEWAGLQGRELGELMANLKATWNWQGLVLSLHESYGSDGVKRWVLEMAALQEQR